MKYTTENFITKSRQVHGNKFDYSLVKYINSSTKILIICSKGHEFLKRPSEHLRKNSGCPYCYGNMTGTTENFIKEGTKIYNGFYQYDKVKYINARTKVEIFCPKHGYFQQTPEVHINRQKGCKRCGVDRTTKTTKEFIIDANKIHNFIYDYSKVDYINNNTFVEIICKNHGSFFQKPHGHLMGKKCQKCRASNGEIEIRNILQENQIVFDEQYKFKNSEIEKCKYDFYLNNYQITIEYHGKQHFQFHKFFHKTIDEFYKRQERDKRKRDFCIKNGIFLFEITYKDNIEEKMSLLMQHIQIAGTPLEPLLPLFHEKEKRNSVNC